MPKQQKDTLYSQILPPYVSKQSFRVHFINACTTIEQLTQLKNDIQQATHFVLDTECDIRSNEAALIQLLVFSKNSSPLSLLLIEVAFLPSSSTYSFQLIQELFLHLFRIDTYLYSWGLLLKEMEKFKKYRLWSDNIRSHVIDVQAIFTKWFDSFLMQSNIIDEAFTNAIDDAIVIHAPSSALELFLPPAKINQIKMSRNELWSLQDSTAYILYQHLSKRDTCKPWTIGLDIRLPNRDKNYSLKYRQDLIQYASHDCTALVDLITFIYDQYLINRPDNEPVQLPGEYFLSLKQRFVFSPSLSSSSFFKSNQLQHDEFILDDDTDYDSEDDGDLWTVHELNERQRSPPNRPSIKHATTTDPPSTEHEKLTDAPSIEHSHENYSLPGQQLSTCALIASPQMILIDEKLTSSVHFIRPFALDAEQNDDTLIVPQKLKRKPCRSLAAQTRRNKKTSSRHRLNRYRFELQRQTNLDVTTMKNILDEYGIEYVNINPVQSVVFIGVKSPQQQQLYEQLLPLDIFI